LTGGALGPVLMLIGLQRVSGVAGALLLNLEAVFTMALAVLLFGDRLSRDEAWAAALVVLGAAVVSYQPGQLTGDWLGAVAIAGACLSWGIDNHLTQRLAIRDPVAIVQIKPWALAQCNLLPALVAGAHLPGPGLLLPCVLVGFVSYGLSIVLDV
jgi:drug/metabolite transporter (DMT)-like permease